VSIGISITFTKSVTVWLSHKYVGHIIRLIIIIISKQLGYIYYKK